LPATTQDLDGRGQAREAMLSFRRPRPVVATKEMQSLPKRVQQAAQLVLAHNRSSRGGRMSIHQRFNRFLLGVLVLGAMFSPAASRPWKPTSIQIAGDYAQINHSKTSTEFVNLRWWAPPSVAPGTPLTRVLEKYVLVSIVHFHSSAAGVVSTDDIEALQAVDGSDMPLTLVPRGDLPPTAGEILSTLEGAFRQSIGRLGNGTKFFVFDAGAVRACEKGKVSIPFNGETYSWETPFPGCS
jgi:hypothetical protein